VFAKHLSLARWIRNIEFCSLFFLARLAVHGGLLCQEIWITITKFSGFETNDWWCFVFISGYLEILSEIWSATRRGASARLVIHTEKNVTSVFGEILSFNLDLTVHEGFHFHHSFFV
jgi:hypothetical protein